MARKNLLILFLLIFVIIFLIFFFNIKSLAISKSKDNDGFSFSILCYHNIKETPSNDYDLSLIDFDRQCIILVKMVLHLYLLQKW